MQDHEHKDNNGMKGEVNELLYGGSDRSGILKFYGYNEDIVNGKSCLIAFVQAVSLGRGYAPNEVPGTSNLVDMGGDGNPFT